MHNALNGKVHHARVSDRTGREIARETIQPLLPDYDVILPVRSLEVGIRGTIDAEDRSPYCGCDMHRPESLLTTNVQRFSSAPSWRRLVGGGMRTALPASD